jgi:hypothetical protein
VSSDDDDAADDDDDDDEYDNATSNEFLGHLGSSHNSSFLCGNLGFDFQNKGSQIEIGPREPAGPSGQSRVAGGSRVVRGLHALIVVQWNVKSILW